MRDKLHTPKNGHQSKMIKYTQFVLLPQNNGAPPADCIVRCLPGGKCFVPLFVAMEMVTVIDEWDRSLKYYSSGLARSIHALY